MFLFPFRAILLQLQVILFLEQIFNRLSLGAKERRIGADSCQKYEDLVPKYSIGAPHITLLQVLLLRQAAYFSISDLEPMVSCATL